MTNRWQRQNNFALVCSCAACGATYKKRRDRIRSPDFCGLECRLAYIDKQKEAQLGRLCEGCSKFFIPRHAQIAAGQGLYCSLGCSVKHALLPAAHSPISRAKAAQTIVANIESGKFVPASGAAHPQWMGGQSATLQRRAQSGKAREQTRRYRRENPHKVREFSMRRRAKKVGRLPRGTVEAIGNKQRWKCPICLVSILKKYHVDHIQPIAKGGRHSSDNIQLLCPPCNVRKSAKDPVQYMQERGFLI